MATAPKDDDETAGGTKASAAASASPAKKSKKTKKAKQASGAKKSKAAPTSVASARDFKAAGTFMPAADDPLDTPDPNIAKAAAALAGAADHDSGPAVPAAQESSGAAPQSARTKPSSVDELDRRQRLRAAFDLDTDEENDFARAAMLVAGTASLALITLLVTSFVVAIYAGIVALAIAGGLAAVYLGYRGYRSAVRGVATNARLALLAILVGGAVVVTTLVVLVMRAVAQ